MGRVRKEVSGYAAEDVYNMDETGLFWKMTPNKGLVTEMVSGTKKKKSRVTVVLACNTTGSDKGSTMDHRYRQTTSLLQTCTDPYAWMYLAT